MALDLRNSGSIGDKIYCKNHLKEAGQISTPAPSTYVSGGMIFVLIRLSILGSFVPATETASETSEVRREKKETSEATGTASKQVDSYS